jgi:outer membrane immunogenic protein
MKRTVLAAVIGAIMGNCWTTFVTAADLPVEPVYVARPPAIGLLNWTGFYVGANFGYARSKSDGNVYAGTFPFLSLSETMSGGLAGIQAGGNWQTGNAVLGMEADIDGTNQTVSSLNNITDVAGAISLPGTVIAVAANDRIKSFGTVRARVGIASGPALYYLTGGLAYWSWASNFSMTGFGTTNLSNFKGGGALGGGVEVAVASDWTVRAEYLYLQSTNISNAPFPVRADILFNTRIRENVFRVGVNYMFFTGSVGCRPHVC